MSFPAHETIRRRPSQDSDERPGLPRRKTGTYDERRVPPVNLRYEFDLGYIERLVAGDTETERHFTRYFGDLLTMKLRSKLRSAALVEDAKQETFVRVLVHAQEEGRHRVAAGPGRVRQLGLQQRAVRDVPVGIEDDAARGGLRRPDERRAGAESTLLGADEQREKIQQVLAAPAEEGPGALEAAVHRGARQGRRLQDVNVRAQLPARPPPPGQGAFQGVIDAPTLIWRPHDARRSGHTLATERYLLERDVRAGARNVRGALLLCVECADDVRTGGVMRTACARA